MKEEQLKSFFWWINERHRIYLKRLAGEAPPWTTDPILQQYKFTNPFRENDRDTVWMREHWTSQDPNNYADLMFNICVFRMFGATDFFHDRPWLKTIDDLEDLKSDAKLRLEAGEKCFTGAYIVTNMGVRKPKYEVVVDGFLKPIYFDRSLLANEFFTTNSLEHAHKQLSSYLGWGGGGFMAYEAVTDFDHTFMDSIDNMTWANAGPGAKRGLNRIVGRDLKDTSKKNDWNYEMRGLLRLAPDYLGSHIPIKDVDMRCIEHSLCEWDKYQRVLLGQGRPRGVFRQYERGSAVKGTVNSGTTNQTS
jgi:hypothetical protein|tara:strand:- start:9421 stop:10335 length:915 start_codon:yes stop_codon:yes gene_type:complete